MVYFKKSSSYINQLYFIAAQYLCILGWSNRICLKFLELLGYFLSVAFGEYEFDKFIFLINKTLYLPCIRGLHIEWHKSIWDY